MKEEKHQRLLDAEKEFGYGSKFGYEFVRFHEPWRSVCLDGYFTVEMLRFILDAMEDVYEDM